MSPEPESKAVPPHVPTVVLKQCLCRQRQISQRCNFRVAFQEASKVL